MRAVGLKVLKNKLSEYVRVAAAGETVLVTDRDRVVVEMRAPQASRSPLVSDAFLADCVRRGVLTPPLNPAAALPTAPNVAPLRRLLEELDEDRSER